MKVIQNSLEQCHEILLKFVKEGDIVVDATAGNGNDTVFLVNLVGDKGKVYSFDIQAKAIENTEKKLEELNLKNKVILILDGHENLSKYVKEEVKAIVFNLGYLPGGNHSIGTKTHTTIKAIEESMKLISVNGLVVLVVYYGGDSGFEEKEAVLEYIKGIDNKKFTVMKTEFVNQINCPPILVCIEKLK